MTPAGCMGSVAFAGRVARTRRSWPSAQIVWASSLNAAATRSFSLIASTPSFVVPAAKVLHERVTADHNARRALRLPTARRSQPGFQSPVVALDAVVCIDARVVLRVREHVVDRTDHGLRLVGRDLLRSSVLPEDAVEEPACCGTVATGRDEDVDHLAVLVDGPIDVAPDASDTDVGFVNEPAATDPRVGTVERRRSTRE